MTRRLKTVLTCALLAGLLPCVDGRVFRVIGDTGGRLNTAGLNWESAYSTKMTVNGRKNDVEVYSVRDTQPVVDQLKGQFEQQGADVTLSRNPDGGAIGVATWDGGEARFLVVAPDTQPNRLVFLFYPEKDAAHKTEFPIPEYPRGRTTNTVDNNVTKTSCATLLTPDSVMQVQRYYAEVLARDGWTPVLPLNVSGGMIWFRKNDKTCCILATPRDNGETVVTLLVRGAGV